MANLVVIAPTTTTAQAQAALQFSVSQQLNNVYSAMMTLWNSLYQSLWNNPGGLAPQDVMTAFGTSAGIVVSAMASLQSDIQAIVPSQSFMANPAGYTVTTNADGSVTITQSIHI